jgi:hypothetical protein
MADRRPPPDPDRGVDFARLDGRVSTTATGRAVFAAAAAAADPRLGDRVREVPEWRENYLAPLKEIVAAAARSSDAALAISRAGCAALWEHMVFVREDEERPVADAMAQDRDPGYASAVVTGTGPREVALSVPYHGRRLAGGDLRRQLYRWVDQGIAEPSMAMAVESVMDNPDWLDLTDVNVAVLGAGAEMGPLTSLLRWGANVHAVDLPRPQVWERVLTTASKGAGVMRVPVPMDHPLDASDLDAVAAVAGADLTARTPEVRTWLDESEGPLVVGNYAYADGPLHVRVSVAADAIGTDLAARRGDVVLAYLATPTDVFMVPLAAVQESRRRWDARGPARLVQAPLRLARQFTPNYPTTITTESGREVGLNDSLVPQQGPNYALAKRLQRWRAIAARADGIPVSLNLAPATRTRSVVKNRALAAAYAGAGRFGIEVFEPATSNTLMAALLVHDLRNRAAAANPAVRLDNPMDLFDQAANHGGLWRVAYSPRSVLGVAALLGMFERRA